VLAIRSQRVVTPAGIAPAAVHVRAGTIDAVTEPEDVPPAAEVVDAGDLVVMPGLVDTHVHCNEPGRTGWEGFASATRAAAAGGVTTILDMPLNSVPPTTTVEALARKREAAAGRCWVDVGFWGGAVPDHLDAIGPLLEAGVRGVKAFLCDSGVPEFGSVGLDGLGAVLDRAAAAGGLVAVHAEAPEPLAAAAARLDGADPRRYATWLAARPPEAEEEAVAAVVALARTTGARAHVVHLSSAGALETLRGSPVTAETCPHYLALSAEEVPDGGTAFKCAPPIREAANAERLWGGLAEGAIGFVVSDHSPSPPDLKRGDFLTAWGGIASLQLTLAATWTAARRRGFGIGELGRWMATAPAAFAGLSRKGAIEPGRDADLVVWEPDAAFAVDPHALHHRHPVTPYAGRTLRGVVRATYVRGEPVYRDGVHRADPFGRLL
jgi:allantoinase